MAYKKAFPSWGDFIREYLLSLPTPQEDFSFNIYMHYNKELKDAGYKPISGRTWDSYIFVLHKLGLIVRTRDELVGLPPAHPSASGRTAIPRPYLYTVDQPPAMHLGAVRHYYAIVAGMETSLLWAKPRLSYNELRGLASK